jgi:hypothetical protein
MNVRRVAPILLVAMFVAACSGAAPGATSNANPTSAGGGLPTPGTGGKVDCAAITTAAQQLIMVQFLAQLKTPDTIASIKSKQVGNLDLDAFIDALNQLHSLDGYTSVLGDPKAAIDYYINVAKAAKVLFATDPMTQAAIDTYNKNIVSVSDFLGRQVAISGAIGQAGC